MTILEITVEDEIGELLRVVKRETGAHNLAEAADQEPGEGAYLVARTWSGGNVLDLDAHFDRLEQSASAMGHPVTVPRASIRRVIATHLPRRGGCVLEGRFRLTAVPHGTPHFILSLEEAHAVAPELLRSGADCRIVAGAARRDAEIKSTSWMHERKKLTGGPEPYEFLLTDHDGFILEGATSNFYAVLGGELWTAGAGVLSGTARRIVFHVAPAVIPIRLEPINVEQLPRVQEAFITSATRGIVPVRRIDQVVYDRTPGPVTRALTELYHRWLEDHLEPLV